MLFYSLFLVNSDRDIRGVWLLLSEKIKICRLFIFFPPGYTEAFKLK